MCAHCQTRVPIVCAYVAVTSLRILTVVAPAFACGLTMACSLVFRANFFLLLHTILIKT